MIAIFVLEAISQSTKRLWYTNILLLDNT